MYSTFYGLISIVSCVFFALYSTGQEEVTKGLKGSVRFILEESFEGRLEDSILVKNGKSRQFSWIPDNKMEFDRNKNLIKRTFYDDEKLHVRTESYFYKDTVLNKKTIQGFTFIYQHNEKGLVSEELLVSKTDSTEARVNKRFRYNANNQLTDIWELDLSGGNVRHQKNQYNSTGQITKETIKYGDGIEYKNYTYLPTGQLDKIEWFDYQEGLLERILFSYSDGRKMKEHWEVFENQSLVSTSTYEFDTNGNPISLLEINEKRRIHDHEINQYEYDHKNNWIKKTTAINNTQFYIVERKIGYYM